LRIAFWPGRSPETARAKLRLALTSMRLNWMPVGVSRPERCSSPPTHPYNASMARPSSRMVFFLLAAFETNKSVQAGAPRRTYDFAGEPTSPGSKSRRALWRLLLRATYEDSGAPGGETPRQGYVHAAHAGRGAWIGKPQADSWGGRAIPSMRSPSSRQTPWKNRVCGADAPLFPDRPTARRCPDVMRT